MPSSPTAPRFPPKPANASDCSSINISTQESKSQPRMSILAVGSVAFDTITTPTGQVDNELGGAATYFGLAASYFAPVRIVAVVGDDFTAEHEAVLKTRGVDTRGIERASGKTFRWGGH